MEISVKKNYIYSIAYQILTIVTPIITIPYVSRVFGAEYLGIYSWTNTVAQYFVLFALMGLMNYGNRTIAMVRDNKDELNRTFCEIYCMQLITGFIAFFTYLVYAIFIADEYRVYSLILTLYVLSAIFDINWLFFGLEKFKLTVTRNTVIKLATVILILTLIKHKEDLWLYTTIFAVGMLASSLALWQYARKEIKWIKPTWSGIKRHFKPNLIMFIPVIAVSIYKYMDKLMLGDFSKTQVGYYENVEKIFTVALGFITAFGSVMLPRMSNIASKGGITKAEITIRNSMRFILGLSFALAFGMSAVSNEFVIVYFGVGFEPCALIMVSLAPTIVFQSWANVIRTQYLIPFQHDRVYVVSVIMGAGINFIINYLLIPKMGAIGAVIGTVAAEICVAVYQTINSRKELHIHNYLIEGLPFLAFGLIMYFAVRYIANVSFLSGILLLTVEIIGGAIVYLIQWGGYEWIMRKQGKSGGYFWLTKYRLKKMIFPTRVTSDEFKKYLILKNVKIGHGTHFFDPSSTTIDIQRPWMLHIGEYCKITQNVTILCHDYSRSVLRRKYGEIIGEAKRTYIGDNVFIGLNSIICMGAHIGNNVIIGAGSVVTGIIPDNSVAAGSPAKVICSLDEYYVKRKKLYIGEAKDYARCFFEANKRLPREREMGPFFTLFLKRDRNELKDKNIFTHLSGDEEEDIISSFLETEPVYTDFQSFLNEALEEHNE